MLSKLLQEQKKEKESSLQNKNQNNIIHYCSSDSSLILNNLKTDEKQYTFHLEILPELICLLFYNKHEYDKVSFMLMKEVIFMNTFSFFSLTICEDEISIFLDQNIVNNFITKNKKEIDCDIKFYQEPIAVDRDYRAIRVFDSMDGVSHIGIVSKISTLLSKSDIPILYVNSYNNNYVLVPDKHLEKAKKCLLEYNFVF
jgi:hypothetical protein